MRHGKKFKKLGRPASHRRAMLRNMVTSLFEHHSIKTTVPKAKEAQKFAERLVRYAIAGTLADKRRIISYLKNKEVAHELIRIGQDKFADRPAGGYTAIYHLAPRKGDGAEMVLLKFLTEPKEKPKKKKKKRKIMPHDVIETVETTKQSPVLYKEKVEPEPVEETETEQEIAPTEEPAETIDVEASPTENEETEEETNPQTEIEEEISVSAEDSGKTASESDDAAQESADAEKDEEVSDEKKADEEN